MASTLEESQLLVEKFNVTEARAAEVLDVLRVSGTRRLNEFKNLGVTTYAFNPLQVSTVVIPELLLFHARYVGS